jgi:hypothetical protein
MSTSDVRGGTSDSPQWSFASVVLRMLLKHMQAGINQDVLMCGSQMRQL